MWQDAEQSRRLPIDTRIALLTANVHASTTAIEVIGMPDIVGSSIAPAGAIFAACLRDDARTLGSHGAVGGHKLELAAGFGLACLRTVLRPDSLGGRCRPIVVIRQLEPLKLPRFRGHRTICVRGVHDGQDERTLPA